MDHARAIGPIMDKVVTKVNAQFEKLGSKCTSQEAKEQQALFPPKLPYKERMEAKVVEMRKMNLIEYMLQNFYLTRGLMFKRCKDDTPEGMTLDYNLRVQIVIYPLLLRFAFMFLFSFYACIYTFFATWGDSRCGGYDESIYGGRTAQPPCEDDDDGYGNDPTSYTYNAGWAFLVTLLLERLISLSISQIDAMHDIVLALHDNDPAWRTMPIDEFVLEYGDMPHFQIFAAGKGGGCLKCCGKKYKITEKTRELILEEYKKCLGPHEGYGKTMACARYAMVILSVLFMFLWYFFSDATKNMTGKSPSDDTLSYQDYHTAGFEEFAVDFFIMAIMLEVINMITIAGKWLIMPMVFKVGGASAAAIADNVIGKGTEKAAEAATSDQV